MSAGDIPTQVPPTINYDSDDSSSSTSLFNRSSVTRALHQQNNTQFIPIVSGQVSPADTNKLHNQQIKRPSLHKFMHDVYNELYELKSIIKSARNSPTSHSRPNSVHHSCQQHSDRASSILPQCRQHIYKPCASLPIHSTSIQHLDKLSSVDKIHYLQEALHQSNIAIERRDNTLSQLQKENDTLRYFYAGSDKTYPNVSTPPMHTVPTQTQDSHTSGFIPTNASAKPPSMSSSTNAFPSTSIMPFTMSLTNTLPHFSGKETEMPMKFITEFEIRASSLVGYSDDYLLRAVQQSLSDSALTWFIQTQQEQPIHTWVKFKESFIRRFRTPEKIELLRGRLCTLWQSETESTADYFERLKALMSEIEPETSTDYIKRKFLQKLRKDIRDRMTLGITSSLPDLLQKAIEIESNIVQQKIDDKLRDAHKEDQTTKQKSTTVNSLLNGPRFNPSSVTIYNDPPAHNNYSNNSNQQRYVDNKYSRTFLNSSRSSPRTTSTQNEFPTDRFNTQQNVKTNRRNHKRWCSFCSSTSHSWSHCYSNPNGVNYQPERHQSVQQYSDQQDLYQPSSRHEVLNPQQLPQQYDRPSSSSYLSSQQFSMPENGQGSRY